nr:hypothetical protein [Paludibacteraceae bacterium]
MKQLHQHISSICARCLLLLCFVFLYINTISANFELYILDNSDNVVTQSTFVNAGTNVADEMTTLVAIPSYTGSVYTLSATMLPDTPVVSNYSACQTPGTKTWASLVTATTGTLVWYADATSTTPIVTPSDFDKDLPQTTSYWVAQESGGIESNRVQVTATVFAMPPVNAAGEDRT